MNFIKSQIYLFKSAQPFNSLPVLRGHGGANEAVKAGVESQEGAADDVDVGVQVAEKLITLII